MGMTTYNRRKALGQCPHCGKDNTRGKACRACKAKIRAYQHNRIMNMDEAQYKEYVDNMAYASKKRKKYIKDNNLCDYCGKVTVTTGSRCEKCRIKYNAQQRKAWHEAKL